MDMEQETRRELESLQRERELLQAKEKDNLDAIDEVRCEGKARLLASGSGTPVPQRGWFIRSGSSGLCDLIVLTEKHFFDSLCRALKSAFFRGNATRVHVLQHHLY